MPAHPSLLSSGICSFSFLASLCEPLRVGPGALCREAAPPALCLLRRGLPKPPSWLQTCDPPASASRAARIPGRVKSPVPFSCPALPPLHPAWGEAETPAQPRLCSEPQCHPPPVEWERHPRAPSQRGLLSCSVPGLGSQLPLCTSLLYGVRNSAQAFLVSGS